MRTWKTTAVLALAALFVTMTSALTAQSLTHPVAEPMTTQVAVVTPVDTLRPLLPEVKPMAPIPETTPIAPIPEVHPIEPATGTLAEDELLGAWLEDGCPACGRG